MAETLQSNRNPAGGPSTVGGVIYQMLWCLLQLSRFEVRGIGETGSVIDSALLVLEPTGGGGDVREFRGSGYTVTQLKSRSSEGTWSLQEIIKGVLPDLLKGVKLDAKAPCYQFVTDGRRGDWDEVERFFQSLRTRDPGQSPCGCLDRSNGLRVGARAIRTASVGDPFWAKDRYSEFELFSKIVDELGPAVGLSRTEFELLVWHLLAHFEFCLPVSVADAEEEIDRSLREVAGRIEDVPTIRRALVQRLAELARSGNATIVLGTFLQDNGLGALPTSAISALQRRTRQVVAQRVRRCGFDPSQHVQTGVTETLVAAVRDTPITILAGESGSGKSWHSYALADALARRGALVAHVEASGTARNTLDSGLGVLWNTVKSQDELLPFDRVSERLSAIDAQRVLIVDRVDDPMVARDLAISGLADSGFRLVLCCNRAIADALRSLPTQTRVMPVTGFSPPDISAYLVARRIPHSESIPSDVRDVLSLPLLARVYCDVAAGATWQPKNEYDLFDAYWKQCLERAPFVIPTLDLSLLRDLGRALLEGEAYPWRAGVVNERVRHEASLHRLQRTGWLVVHPGGECSLWHDRLLNWLVAETVVEDFTSGRMAVSELSKVVASSFAGDLRAGGRWMGYVALDAIWLLADRKSPSSVMAEVFASVEQGRRSHAFYRDSVPTLGGRAVPALLARLDQLLASGSSRAAMEVATCLARTSGPEAVAKARNLLQSTVGEQQAVALHILRRQGDPVSLDRLWSLHVAAPDGAGQVIEYQQRMEALAAAVAMKPAWLQQRLATSTSDTPRLVDLVFLLAGLATGGDAWRALKGHLKAVVPKDTRRCLLRCIMVFRDTSEVQFLREQSDSDLDFAGDTAMAALTRLAPEVAIQDLSSSTLRYVALTRGWHLHPLLAAKPDETRAAIRMLTMSAAGRAGDLYADAENEIDSESFDDILTSLQRALRQEIESGNADANSGPVHGHLNFVEEVCRTDLLNQLWARRGTDLEASLVEYLLAIGPRNDVHARLCDRTALELAELIGSDRLARVVEAGLEASSWHGRIDAVDHAHKHADAAVLAKLRALAVRHGPEENDKFVAYVAAHALCLLEDWEELLAIVSQSGLAVSPYLFEQRREMPALSGAAVDTLFGRVLAGEASPGVLLAAGLTRDSRFIAPITSMLLGRPLSRDEALSAALALDVLDGAEEVVEALATHLADATLRERLLGLLLGNGSVAALQRVAESLEEYFDSGMCAALGKHAGFEQRAARLAWDNREKAARSIGYGDVVPLFGHVDSAESTAYLDRLAYGLERSPLGASLRLPGIRGLAIRDKEAAFSAAERAFRDRFCEERAAIAQDLLTLDAGRASPILLEAIRTVNDEGLEMAIADALSSEPIESILAAMLDSESAASRRAACILASRRLDLGPLRDLLREHALDPDEGVARAAIMALRMEIRSKAVADLVKSALEVTERPRRWVLLECAVRHACGRRDAAPVPRAVLHPLDEGTSPLEALRLNKVLKKGREEYERGIESRARERATRRSDG